MIDLKDIAMHSRQDEGANVAPMPLTFVVEGMSCEHCKLAITEEVSRVSGVDSVEVDLDSKLVRVRGTAVDDVAVVDAIDEAGYEAVTAMSAEVSR
jgi:copper chaperone